jgi:hypothetical protein
MTQIAQDPKLEFANRLVPNLNTSVVAIPAPGEGPGFWVGASSAVYADGAFYMAYRMRRPITQGRGGGVQIAKSSDGVHFETVAQITKDEMNCESLERPALVKTPEGKWRLYLSCATFGAKHWRIELLEASSPADFDSATRRVVVPGDKDWGVKDPVVKFDHGYWQMWACFHPLGVKNQEDRMESRYATSDDGVVWTWHGTALAARPGMWDSRGARVCAVVHAENGYTVFYDGRKSSEENYEERTGIALGAAPDKLAAVGESPVAQTADGKAVRYLDVVELPDSRFRLYFEVARQDGAHELRTQLV